MSGVFLDTSIVIYFVEGVSPWAMRVDAALRRRRDAVITDLVRMEARVGPLKSGDRELLQRFDNFFARVGLIPLTRAVFDRAAEIRASTGLKTPDALHLAAALEHGCDELWTNDRRFHAVAGRLAVRIL